MKKDGAMELMEKYLRGEGTDPALKKLATLTKLTEKETKKYFKEAVVDYLRKNRQISEDMLLSAVTRGIEPTLRPYLLGINPTYVDGVLNELQSEGKIDRLSLPIKRKRCSGGLFIDRYNVCRWNTQQSC